MRNWHNGPSVHDYYREAAARFRKDLSNRGDAEFLSKPDGTWLKYAEDSYALHAIQLIEDKIDLTPSKRTVEFNDGFGDRIRKTEDVLIMRVPFEKVPQLETLMRLGLVEYDISGPPFGFELDTYRCEITLPVGTTTEAIESGRRQVDTWVSYINKTVNSGRESFLQGAAKAIEARRAQAQASTNTLDELRKSSPYPIREADK